MGLATVGLVSLSDVYRGIMNMADVDMATIDLASMVLVGLSDIDFVHVGLKNPAASWDHKTACCFYSWCS